MGLKIPAVVARNSSLTVSFAFLGGCSLSFVVPFFFPPLFPFFLWVEHFRCRVAVAQNELGLSFQSHVISFGLPLVAISFIKLGCLMSFESSPACGWSDVATQSVAPLEAVLRTQPTPTLPSTLRPMPPGCLGPSTLPELRPFAAAFRSVSRNAAIPLVSSEAVTKQRFRQAG